MERSTHTQSHSPLDSGLSEGKEEADFLLEKELHAYIALQLPPPEYVIDEVVMLVNIRLEAIQVTEAGLFASKYYRIATYLGQNHFLNVLLQTFLLSFVPPGIN